MTVIVYLNRRGEGPIRLVQVEKVVVGTYQVRVKRTGYEDEVFDQRDVALLEVED